VQAFLAPCDQVLKNPPFLGGKIIDLALNGEIIHQNDLIKQNLTVTTFFFNLLLNCSSSRAIKISMKVYVQVS
jgi:hypothetical protein